MKTMVPSIQRVPAAALVVMMGVLLARPATLHAQTWTAHTSLRQTTALAEGPDAIWVATTGGLYRQQVATGEVQRLTAAEGLHAVDVQAVAYGEGCACVWIGYRDGVIDRLDPVTGTIRPFRDIERATQFSNRSVNRLVVEGDSLFIATAFGIVVFDPVREEVRDTYSRLGAATPAAPVNDVLVAPLPGGAPGLWAATDEGVAYAPLTGVNLQDPASWTLETVAPDRRVLSLARFQGTLYAGTDTDLYRRTDDGTYEALSVSGTAVSRLRTFPERLLGVDRFGLVSVEADGTRRRLVAPAFEDPVDALMGPAGQVWIGDAQEGLVVAGVPATGNALDVQRTTFPDGPYHGTFSDLAVGAEGSLWAGGPDAPIGGTGLYELGPDGTWTNYIGRFVPVLEGLSRVTRVHVADDGTAWGAAEGGSGGLVAIDEAGDVTVFDQENSSLRPVVGTFIIVGGVTTESSGRVWATTRGTGTPLHTRDPDGTWTGLSPSIGDGLTSASTAYDRVFIDSFGQLWIIVQSERDFNSTIGLLVRDVMNTPTDPSDDAHIFFNDQGGSGVGLPSVKVNATAEDRDGRIWLATDEGPAQVLNTGIVARDPNTQIIWPQWADRARGTFVLRGAQINDITIDPANRIWLATEEDGAWLIESVENGYALTTQFTTDNSPLFSDKVLAVEVDPQSGRVYFSTDEGLISFAGEAVAPRREAGDLIVYPNPVRVDAGAEAPSIFIEGLVEETELRIVAPHGAVVAELRTRGGRVRWDGRDRTGALVPSGVYLVVAVGQNGEGTAYGKVAIIR